MSSHSRLLLLLELFSMALLTATGAECASANENERALADDRLALGELVFYRTRTAERRWPAKDQDTLRQVLLVHRHGDRTPIVFSHKDPLAQEPFWTFHGLSQLTNRGKARLHMLGLILRQRYDEFLGGSLNKNSRKTRASGSLRCIESAQVVLASFLGLDGPGSETSPDVKSLTWDRATSSRLSHVWQPASVQTLAAEWDGMLNEGAKCARMAAEFDAIDASEAFKQLQVEFAREARVLKEELDTDTEHFYQWYWAASLLEVERSYFSARVNPKLLAIYDRVNEAGDRALVMLQESLNMRRYRAGLLVDDMLKNLEAMRAGTSGHFVKKFVHYSAHDVTLIFLKGLLGQLDKFPVRSNYAGSLLYELHEDSTTNTWFLKFFYMHTVPATPVELHIDGCQDEQGRCTLDKFAQLMEKYRVTSWANWMQECGNTFMDVNPYAENL